MNYRIGIEDTDVAFECAPGQSLLDAALAAGIGLPYSCRKGVCGSCVGSLATGEVSGIGGSAMRNDSCSPEQVLFCTCTPQEDVVLRPVSWTRLEKDARKTFTAKVYSNDLVAPDVSLLKLRLPAGQRAKFKSGQYLQVLLDDGSQRSYSMANPPQESDSVTLHIRHVPGGRFSAQVTQLVPGQTLQIELPFGHVALNDDDLRPIVLVAGGTGFAPVKSILDDWLKRRVQRPVTLIWAARTQDGLYLEPAVQKWKKQWPDFRYVPALSDAPPDELGEAFAGRADEALSRHCPDLSGHQLYCCGSPPMVASVRTAALANRLAAADFHADVFVPGPTGLPG